VERDQLEAFLALAEELHFGRAAERLRLTQPRVSRLIRALERHVGGSLFERTSRRVRLTVLGEQFLGDLEPAYKGLIYAIEHAKAAARDVRGRLTVGFTITSATEALSDLIAQFAERFPDCEVAQRDVNPRQPFAALRSGEIDVLVNWQLGQEPDLTLGPVVDRQERVLAVRADSPLAKRESISAEELAGLPTATLEGGEPAWLHEGISPTRTPSGVSIPRGAVVRSITEAFALVAAGQVVHPTAAAMSRLFGRKDIAWIPIHDMAPLNLGLMWLTANTNARILAFAHGASTFRHR
jgi:DNA-binding transcriptional LysR family regulator